MRDTFSYLIYPSISGRQKLLTKIFKSRFKYLVFLNKANFCLFQKLIAYDEIQKKLLADVSKNMLIRQKSPHKYKYIKKNF